ncbi:MAG: TolC family protein [bacterium]|nr:TolC family protein [bacterium]
MRKISLIGFIFLLVASQAKAEEALTLEKCVELAIKNSPVIHQAWLEKEEAAAKITEAGAAFYPRLELSTTYTRLDEKPSLGGNVSFGEMSLGDISFGDDDIYSLKGSAQQPLYTGGRIAAAYRMAKISKELTDWNCKKVTAELILEVRSGYFQVLKAEKFKLVAGEAVRQVEAHRDLTSNLLEAGIVTKADLLKAEVALAQAKQNLMKAEDGLKLSQGNLNILLGRAGLAGQAGSAGQAIEEKVTLEELTDYESLELSLDTCLKEALANRPELKQMEINIALAKLGIRLAGSSYYPQVALIGNYDYQKGSSQAATDWKGFWSITLSGSINPWDFGKTRSQVEQAGSKLGQTEDGKARMVNGITLEVQRAYLASHTAFSSIEVAKGAIGEAEESLRITEERYKEGVSTSTDVLDAQTDLTSSRTNYYAALYDYFIARAELSKAIGKLGIVSKR